MDNLNIEISPVVASYFDEDALRFAPVPIYRLDGAGRRLYYSVEPDKDEEVDITFYLSVTSIIKETTPTSPFLIQWIASKGGDAENAKNERAAYGTLMHILFEDVLNARITLSTFDLGSITDLVGEYLMNNPTVGAIPLKWAVDLRRDVLAFASFLEKYRVVPIGIEMPLKSDRFRVAGTSDLFFRMTIEVHDFHGETYKTGPRTGQPKKTKKAIEVYALIDFKSSRKAVYFEHEIQLAYYKEIWIENFPEFKDKPIRLYNLRMKDWQTEPSVVLTDQTGKHTVRELELRRDLYFETNDLASSKKTLIGGEIDFGGEFKTSDYFDRVSLTDYVRNRLPKNFSNAEDTESPTGPGLFD